MISSLIQSFIHTDGQSQQARQTKIHGHSSNIFDVDFKRVWSMTVILIQYYNQFKFWNITTNFNLFVFSNFEVTDIYFYIPYC